MREVSYAGRCERPMHNLALMCFNGKGVEVDFIKASEWFMKSANQGDEGAQYFLAQMYDEGTGVEKDLNKAFLNGIKKLLKAML